MRVKLLAFPYIGWLVLVKLILIQKVTFQQRRSRGIPYEGANKEVALASVS